MQITHKTTMRELFLNIWPALAELGNARLKNGRSQLDVARNYQTVQLAIQPVEKIREQLQKELAGIQQAFENKSASADELANKNAEVNQHFDEMLDVEHSIKIWVVPHDQVAEHLTIKQTAALMFMLATEGDNND